MRLMGCRYEDMKAGVAAMQQGAVPFVGHNGTEFYPLGKGDDMGSYYFVPQIARHLDLPIELASDVFYFGALAISFLIGAAGLAVYLRTWAGRAAALAGLTILGASVVQYGDVYLAAPCCAVACVPWAFWIAERSKRLVFFLGSALAMGVLMGTSNFIRIHTGTSVLLTTLILVGFAPQFSLLRRFSFIAVLFAGMVIPSLYQMHLLNQADAYLRVHATNYYRLNSVKHPFWHSIYIGLGYLTNSHGITYDDSVAVAAVREVDPTVGFVSKEYELILRNRVLDLYKRDPEFIYQTVFAKVGYVAFCFVRIAPVAILLACFGVLTRRQLLALACGTAYSSLPGILVMPPATYLLGMQTFASLFGILCVGKAFEHSWNFSRWSAWAATRRQSLARILARLADDRWPTLVIRFAVVAVGFTLAAHYAHRAYATAAQTVATSYRDTRLDVIKQMAKSGRLPVTRQFELADLNWRTTAQGADLKKVDGELALKTGGHRYEFQLESLIPITEDIVYATYEIEVLQGGVALGILDQTGVWTENTYCVKPGIYRGKLAAYVPGTRDVRLIVYNFNQTTAVNVSSMCRIKEFTVTLSSESSPPAVTVGTDGGGTLKR